MITEHWLKHFTVTQHTSYSTTIYHVVLTDTFIGKTRTLLSPVLQCNECLAMVCQYVGTPIPKDQIEATHHPNG